MMDARDVKLTRTTSTRPGRSLANFSNQISTQQTNVMVKLNFSVAASAPAEEGTKIDLSPVVNDHFHKVDGGLTVYTKEEDVSELFDGEDEIVAVFMTPGKYERIMKNAEDNGELPYKRNDDGTIEIKGERFVLESDAKRMIEELRASIHGPQNEEKAAPAKDLQPGAALEDRDKDRGLVSGRGPDTQIE